MYLESTEVLTDLDPRLQRLVEKRRRGVMPRATFSTASDELAVVARVDDVRIWQNHSDIRAGVDIPVIGGGNSSHIVTGRVPATSIEAVRQLPGVRSLKPAHAIRPVLSATTSEIHAEKAALPALAQGAQGTGTVVGIIDFGCDFVHQNFRKADGTTRLLALWDQTAAADAASPFGYGKLHLEPAINTALASSAPYAALGYAPEPESHGTHVMDIAGGNGRGTGVPGVAPQADLVFVQLSASDIIWDGEGSANSTFGDSVQLLEAAKFIFDFAGERPCVLNLSLGTNGGPHDGSTLVEQGLDSLLRQAPNRAIVIAAANSHDDGIHASGIVSAGSVVDLAWRVDATDPTSNELELWYSGSDEFVLELILPSGQSLGQVRLGSNARAQDESGQTVLFAAHRKQDPNNGDNVIDIFLEAGLPAGTWLVRLHPVTIDNGRFHAWIERDGSGQSRFVAPLDNTHTLGSISCGRETLVVGSYDAHRADTPLSSFSSEGPTRDGRFKPELSAPGHRVVAANARTLTGTVNMSGTSMAAPAVAGVAALIVAEAAARGLALASEDLRTIIMSTARKAAGAAGWDPRYGQGRVDAAAAVASVIARSEPLPEVPSA